MPELIRILMVEDSPEDEALLLRTLQKGGLSVAHERVQTETEMRAALERAPWDLVLSDYSMPSFDGIAAYNILRATGREIPFIFVSGNLGEETAVEAMRLGVSDYFIKGKLQRLVPAIQRELRKTDDRRARHQAESALQAAKDQLQHAQKMEALARLAGGVAHDFNNLLTVILGHLDLLRDGDLDAAAVRSAADEIQVCVERATELTKQLLALGRRQPSQIRAVDLNQVVQDVGKMISRLIGEDIEVAYELAAALPPVQSDPGQVEQLLLNLAINARDAMPKGGHLRISTRLLRLSAAQLAAAPDARPGDFALLEVQDSGTGIAPEVLEHIFEPFFTTKDSGQGTGLGLSTVYGIVRQNRGHLSVHSVLGQGSSFQVHLPVSAEALRKAPPAVSQPLLPKSGGVILLVEDEDGLRRLAVAVLSKLGYTVLPARDPHEALDVEAGHPGGIDLLLTDLTMPKMSGHELARRLSPRRPRMRVLYMTGYAPPDTPEELNGQPVRCLLKPFLPSDLAREVQQLLKIV
jgi:signal transduction histidine kinase